MAAPEIVSRYVKLRGMFARHVCNIISMSHNTNTDLQLQGSLTVCKWLVVRPFCLSTDKILQQIKACSEVLQSPRQRRLQHYWSVVTTGAVISEYTVINRHARSPSPHADPRGHICWSGGDQVGTSWREAHVYEITQGVPSAYVCVCVCVCVGVCMRVAERGCVRDCTSANTYKGHALGVFLQYRLSTSGIVLQQQGGCPMTGLFLYIRG